jgi:hypothetical protein
MLSKCGEQARLRYIEGIKRPPNAFLLCGTATDVAVTKDLDTKIATGDLADEDVLTDAARDSIEKNPDKNAIVLDDEDKGKSIETVLGETKDKAVRLVKAHHGNVAPTIQPWATARKFSVDLDAFLRKQARDLRNKRYHSKWAERVADQHARYLNVAAMQGMDFVGEQDIVERISESDGGAMNLVIRDTKTSKKSPAADAADSSNQLTAYSVASHVIDGQIPSAVKLDFLVDLKKETKTVTLESSRTMDDIELYLNRMTSAIATLQSGNFVPAPDTAWWCDPRYCGYYGKECRYTRTKAALVQITETTPSPPVGDRP